MFMIGRTEKRGMKVMLRIMVMAAAAVLFFAVFGYGDGTFAAEKTLVRSSETYRYTCSQSLDNDKLFEAYAENVFSEEDTGLKAHEMGSKLTGCSRTIYDFLRKKITKTADGRISSTVFEMSLSDLKLEGLLWTKDDLNIDKVSDNGEITKEAKNALALKLGIDYDLIHRALLADCPYELYWYDKVTGTKISAYEADVKYDDNEWKVYLKSGIVFHFSVSEKYSDGMYCVNTANVERVRSAVQNAKSIVAEAENEGDLTKLKIYKDRICELVSFDKEAERSGGPYGDAWQLISVFDGDAGTNAVCEGYSKAFKYLCDLTDFRGNIYCITATGSIKNSSGTGKHMWNIVHMEDGNNYLADITNCDEGSIGEGDRLFLTGYSTGDIASGYVIYCNSYDVVYVYDSESLNDCYEDLIISKNSYEYTIYDSGLISEDMEWIVDSKHALIIRGTGEMPEAENTRYFPGCDFLIQFPWQLYSEYITKIVIEEGISKIPLYAFSFMPCAETIYLPKSMSCVDPTAFDGSYMSFEVDKGNPKFSSENGILLDKAGKTLIAWPSAVGDVVIPDGIETVAESAFNHYFYHIAPGKYPKEKEITSIVFPESVKLVDNSAFCGRFGLRSVIFKNDDARIGPCAFSLCEQLETVKLPKNIQVIDAGAFQRTAINEIDLPESVRLIDNSAFDGCSELTEITIPGGVTEIGECSFLKCGKLKKVNIPESLRRFGVHCFMGTPFQEKNIADGMLILNNVLVEYTGTKETVIVPEGITDVCNAFFENGSVKKVVLPKSLKTLYHCYALIAQVDGDDNYSLNTIIFRSNAPEETDSRFVDWYRVFVEHPGVDIYYPECADGWRSVNIGTPYCHLTDDYIPVTQHDWDDGYSVDRAATCSETGIKSIHCKNCGMVKDRRVIDAEDHDYVHVAEPPKVGVKGKEYDLCLGCGMETDVKTIPALKPAKTKITKLTSCKKGFKAKWTRRDYTGYQVRYSTKASMSSAVYVDISGSSRVSKKITGLKAKKKYYVQVRTYMDVDGRNWYSDWSAKRSVKTKNKN